MNRILKRSSAKRRTTTGSDRTPVVSAAASPKGRPRRIALKAATTVVSTAVVVSVLLGADLYLHRKHGINLWGYRGPAVGQKQPGEKRIVVLGGSTAWGFGLSVGQDFPSQLQQRLAKRSQPPGGPSIKVLNLAFNNEGAYSFKYTLKDYDYLDYDAVVLYSGYNDTSENRLVFRHRSPVFIWTGYLPLLPTLTMDRISAWRRRPGKESEPIVFAPPGRNDSETSKQRSKSLQKQLGPLTDSGQTAATISEGACPAEWQFYCQQIYDVTDSALKHGKRVLVVTEPYISDKHVEQQRALEAMLKQRFEGQAHLRYLNLGRAVDLQDRALCWDGMHLTEEGNRRIAEALIQPVLEILQR
ncbi:MAG TPA: SGNH/GDSL hydrolase family protein [Pyrinomonadaceae bacterium]|nr:SGNH/GDSL hydrolase family protein [Pyrinomonadaceae bacterium]